MPKMKTKTAAKKQFKLSATGKITHRHAGRSHNMEHKTRALKRRMRLDQDLAPSDGNTVLRMLGKK